MKHEWSQNRREQAFHNSGARFAPEPKGRAIPLIWLIFLAGILGVFYYG